MAWHLIVTMTAVDLPTFSLPALSNKYWTCERRLLHTICTH